MTMDNKESSKKPAAEHHDLQAIQQLKEYIIPIGIGIGVALVVVIAMGVIKSNKSGKIRKASIALESAKTVDDIQAVVKNYKGTPAAPAALLALANGYFQTGNYLMAKSSYDRFIKDYPDHLMAPAAEISKAYCLEAEGDIEGALEAFQQFAETQPDYFLYSQAVFSQARCLEQLEQYNEAIAVLENFIVSDPSSRWASNAEQAILYVEKAKRAKEKGIEPILPTIQAQEIPIPFMQPEMLPVTEPELISAPIVKEEEPVAEIPDVPVQEIVEEPVAVDDEVVEESVEEAIEESLEDSKN